MNFHAFQIGTFGTDVTARLFWEPKVQDRWGFFIRMSEEPEFYAIAFEFQRLCEGYDPKALAKELVRQGILRPAAASRFQAAVRLDSSRTRMAPGTRHRPWTL